MNTPLATLQLPSEGAGSALAAENNISFKQQDTALSEGFGPLLDQAHATLPSQPANNATPLADAENLALQLQSLPQGGKLLPLLQQVLNSAEHAGVDAQKLVDRIAARLEQVQADGDLNPAEDIALALHQILANIPDSQRVAPSHAAIVAAVDGKTLKSGSVAAETTGRSSVPLADSRPLTPFADSRPLTPLADSRPLTPLADSRLAVMEMADKPIPVETLPSAKNTSLDKAMAQLLPQGAEARNTELASMMAAFRRPNTNLLKQAEIQLRTDPATANVVTTSVPAQSSPSAPPGLPTITLGTPLNQGAWDQALGERIQWMANHKLQGAQIKLNPANLGPMEVRIQVQNEQASIQFTSAHGVVREALEAALPRLRDMFDASGVELVDVDVSGQSFAEQQRTAGEGGDTAWRGAGPEQDAELETVLDTPLDGFLESGRLDLFA
jgi:flagellar hook-length control protein FliK